MGEQTENPVQPLHYRTGSMETIDKIARVTDGLTGLEAYCIGNATKYIDRAGKKRGEDAETDLAKANAYIRYALHGRWPQ